MLFIYFIDFYFFILRPNLLLGYAQSGYERTSFSRSTVRDPHQCTALDLLQHNDARRLIFGKPCQCRANVTSMTGALRLHVHILQSPCTGVLTLAGTPVLATLY